MKRTIIVLLVALTITLAGCGGPGDAPEDNGDAPGNATGAPGDETEPAEPGGEETGSPSITTDSVTIGITIAGIG